MLRSAARQILRDDRGVSATIVAIAFPGLIGLGALGAETGIWFTISFRNQSAADAAAISAAYEVIAGKTDVIGDLTPAASEAAARNGYTGTTPIVSYPYSDAFIGNGIAVTLQESQATFLAVLFLSNATVVNKAIAAIETLNHPCVLALGTVSTDVELAAAASLVMPDCSVAANSVSSTAIEFDSSNSTITAATLVTAGEISMQGGPIDPTEPPSQFSLAIPPMVGASPVADPYASTLTHGYLTTSMPRGTRCTANAQGSATAIYTGACSIPGRQLINTEQC